MASLFRSLSQRFRRSKRRNQDGGIAGTSEYQQGFDQPEMDSRKQYQCKVMLLDGTDMNVVISKAAVGQELYEQVFYALDLEERDYFGLQFMDHYHVQHWLDPVKRISKQVPIGPPYTFRFRVKFYSSEPNNLREELTRYQFFLQLKQDIQSGRLECPKDTAVELSALALQSELGDYNPAEHTAALISEFRFHPEQDEEMEIAILEKFVTCRGQSPATAEINYLNKAKWIELYGVDMHTVEGRDGNYYRLGLTPTGMLVFDGNQKIGLFLWEKIQKLDFKNRKITLVVEEDADQASGHVQLHTFVFNLSSHKACKHLWKCAIEHHTFFRLKYHKPRSAKASQLFRLGSTFRYRGRTEYENVHKDGGRLSRRQSATFERRPSQRYGPRQSLINKRIQIRNDIKKQVGVSAGLPVPNVAASAETSLSSSGDDKQKSINGSGFGNAELRSVDGYGNSSGTKASANKVMDFENNEGIKEFEKSPYASKRQYSPLKGFTNSASTSLPLANDVNKTDSNDVCLNLAQNGATSRWPNQTAAPVTAAVDCQPGHVTTIAVSSNGSQVHTTNSMSHNDSLITDNSSKNINGMVSSVAYVSPIVTAPQNSHHSYIPQSFPEEGSKTKSSGSSISSSAVSSPLRQTTPTKIPAESPVRSLHSSPSKNSMNHTFIVSPEKAFQNSVVTDGSSTVISGPALSSTKDNQSFIRPPSTTDAHHPVSYPAAALSTTPTSTSVTRTDTFNVVDRKPFTQNESGKRFGSSVSASHLPETQSRIPQLRTVKAAGQSRIPQLRTVKSTGSAVVKATGNPPASFTSVTHISDRNVEPGGAVSDKVYRSRLPVRTNRGGGSSRTTSHGPRTTSYDERISQSRIPVMTSSVHPPQPQTGQM